MEQAKQIDIKPGLWDTAIYSEKRVDVGQNHNMVLLGITKICSPVQDKDHENVLHGGQGYQLLGSVTESVDSLSVRSPSGPGRASWGWHTFRFHDYQTFKLGLGFAIGKTSLRHFSLHVHIKKRRIRPSTRPPRCKVPVLDEHS